MLLQKKILNYLASFVQTRRQNYSRSKPRNVMLLSIHGSGHCSSSTYNHEPYQEYDANASWDEGIAIYGQFLAYRSYDIL